MKTDTSKQILAYIRTNKQARAHDLGQVCNISQVAIHKQLKKLLEKGEIQKVGKPPKVFYIPSSKQKVTSVSLSDTIAASINNTYLYITPQGEMLPGVEGFQHWVKAIKEEHRTTQLAQEYVQTYNQTEAHRSSHGWIDATEKMRTTFQDPVMQKLFYADFYSIPKFGKTKLGQLVLHAKQSQNMQLCDSIVTQVKPVIEHIVKEYAIDTLAFVPASVPRKLQFMQEFQQRLALHLPQIKFTKAYKGEIVVPQKTLSRLEERIENARDTIFIDMNQSPTSVKNVLLIDDAVGSGATLHETAKKLQQLHIVQGTIIGFAIVGSMKGFEVLREV